jgi:hypothetical protein
MPCDTRTDGELEAGVFDGGWPHVPEMRLAVVELPVQQDAIRRHSRGPRPRGREAAHGEKGTRRKNGDGDFWSARQRSVPRHLMRGTEARLWLRRNYDRGRRGAARRPARSRARSPREEGICRQGLGHRFTPIRHRLPALCGRQPASLQTRATLPRPVRFHDARPPARWRSRRVSPRRCSCGRNRRHDCNGRSAPV